MKQLAVLFFTFAICQVSLAQRNLSGSVQTSPYTYVYKLDRKETEALAQTQLKKVEDRYLHQLVDSFQTGSKVPLLPEGNYLLVWAKANQLVYNLRSEGNLSARLIGNDHDVSVVVHTLQGKFLSDAQVYLDKKHLAFNKGLQAYGPVKHRKPKRIKVVYNDVVYHFPTHNNLGRYGRKETSWQKITKSFPIKYVVQPFRKLFHNESSYRRFFDGPTPYEQKFRSFLVFSKPKYKPGDTVKLKAFVQTARGKPVKQPLLLRLSDGSLTIDTILGMIHPYRPGGFDYQFVLSDSLDIDLDDGYTITLEELRSRKYNLDDYDGDLDDDEYAMKRKVVARGRFEYEEYELHSINFSARSDKKGHNRGETYSLYLKATDENELAVMDGRIEILVQPDNYGQTEFHASQVFLPDTLWYHSQNLENVGETRINLPDSIFPRVDFSYRIICKFLNTNNETQTQTIYEHFRDDIGIISFETHEDSLHIDYKRKGLSTPIMGLLYTLGDTDTLAQTPITLPAHVKVNPFAIRYQVLVEGVEEIFNVRSSSSMVNCLSSRTWDSVAIQLVNPGHLPLWYTIFAGNKIVLHGSGDSLVYLDKVRTAKNYFVSLQYIYAGQVHKENFTIPYQDKLLQIKVDQPSFVYPGQTTQIQIQVKDASGNPVPGADVTASGFTRKFQASRPYVPYLGKIYPLRKRHPVYQVKDKEELESEVQMNWQRWSREMNLDSIEYYRFLHPKTIYRNEEPVNGSITQIAPFVAIKGNLQPIHMVYIDEKPIFFSQSQQLQRYSFPLSEGKHSIRLRTRNQQIRLDSIWITKGLKTFLCINADTSNHEPGIHFEKMPDTLTRYEQGLWRRYMILVENNFRPGLAYIRQEDRFYQLPEHSNYNNPFVLTGPFNSRSAELVVKNSFRQKFEPEGGWQFTVSQGLIKQKQWLNLPGFHSNFPTTPIHTNFHDLVLTEKEIDSIWQDYLDNRSHNEDLFRNESINQYGNGRLQIGGLQRVAGRPLFIRNILLFRYDDPDFLRVYKGSATDLGFVRPGNYRMFLLLNENRYFIRDSIAVVRDGLNYYGLDSIHIKEADSISLQISQIIENRNGTWTPVLSTAELDQIKETFHEKYFDPAVMTETLSGVLVDEKGGSIAGASVTVKGTHFGTNTDIQGRFTIKAPPKGRLVFSAVGFMSQEAQIQSDKEYKVVLKEASHSLQEVVVTGYGATIKRDLTGSISSVENTLMGKAAGVMIRGAASMENNSPPLFIVDGLPYSGRIEDLDKTTFQSMNVLSSAIATAMYGARASGGVIIITTKKPLLTDADLPMAGNTLRHQFRDDAFWQPRLQTNNEGKVSFPVTFPDDITSWRTIVIAAGPHRQTGFAEGLTKSFKALSGNIALPTFTIAGDVINVIGKTLNYLPDSIQVKRTFSVNGQTTKEGFIGLRNSWIDTFIVSSLNQDSIKMRYTVEKAGGYWDGEERSIPLFQPGVMETSGMFAALRNDTSFTLAAFPDTTIVKIYAEASLLPVLYDEAESVREYEYLCNEQLASKLKALLVQKKVDQYLHRSFPYEKNIREIVRMLGQGKSSSGLWGWWTATDPSMWISLHAIEALLQAQQSGYTVSLNKTALTDYLVFNLENYQGVEKISSLFILQQLGAKVDYKKYLDSLEKHPVERSLYEQLRLEELKQRVGEKVVPDSFLVKQNHTALGNVYWGDDEYHLFNNSIQNTLTMYRLLRGIGGYSEVLEKIRSYFLEKRKTGHWRNTYESSLILETILPDLLAENDQNGKPALSIKSDLSVIVQDFPFSTEVRGGQPLTISKQGKLPVYFTAYQQYWNKNPDKLSGNFAVHSTFEHNQQPVSLLKGGNPVTLKVHVSVKADADFVLVEIPIPAGCSYADKKQPHTNNEVHREYFKNKVSIFCKSLEKGEYSFEVALLPRYNGIYTLNPAKAEMMYFPVFNGREAIRKVEIR